MSNNRIDLAAIDGMPTEIVDALADEHGHVWVSRETARRLAAELLAAIEAVNHG